MTSYFAFTSDVALAVDELAQKAPKNRSRSLCLDNGSSTGALIRLFEPPRRTCVLQLVYISSARELITEATCRDILLVSRRNNLRDGISGLLSRDSGGSCRHSKARPMRFVLHTSA